MVEEMNITLQHKLIINKLLVRLSSHILMGATSVQLELGYKS